MVLYVEVAVNNQPLTYVEDDVELSVLTPAVIMYGESYVLPEEEVHLTKDVELRKGAR